METTPNITAVLEQFIRLTVFSLFGEDYIDNEPTTLAEAIEIVRELVNDTLDALQA